VIVWYNMYVSERDGATGQSEICGIRRTVATSGTRQSLSNRDTQARANHGGEQGWGVAVGILSIEDCGERGNP
jgi:hypothetical protein